MRLPWENHTLKTAASSVRISADTVQTLAKLAVKLGQPKARVIQRGLQELEERVFGFVVGEPGGGVDFDFSSEAGGFGNGLAEVAQGGLRLPCGSFVWFGQLFC